MKFFSPFESDERKYVTLQITIAGSEYWSQDYYIHIWTLSISVCTLSPYIYVYNKSANN